MRMVRDATETGGKRNKWNKKSCLTPELLCFINSIQ